MFKCWDYRWQHIHKKDSHLPHSALTAVILLGFIEFRRHVLWCAWMQTSLSHKLPGFILLANVAHKTLQHYSHLWILWKVLLELQMPVQSQSTWFHQRACPPGCSLVCCLGVGHQSPRSWCWPAGSGQSIVGLLSLSAVAPCCLGRVWRQTGLYRLPVFPWHKHNAHQWRPLHICRSRDGALLGAEDKPWLEFLHRLSITRDGRESVSFVMQHFSKSSTSFCKNHNMLKSFSTYWPYCFFTLITTALKLWATHFFIDNPILHLPTFLNSLTELFCTNLSATWEEI